MEIDGFNLGNYEARVSVANRSQRELPAINKAKTMAERVTTFRAEWKLATMLEKTVFIGSVLTAVTLIAAPMIGIYYANAGITNISTGENINDCKHFVDISLVTLDIGRNQLIERFASNRIPFDVLTFGDFGYQTATDRVRDINNLVPSDIRVLEPMVHHSQHEGHFYRSEAGDCRMALYYP